VSAVEPAVAALEGRERILVFTGAGISTESGIPDFRGPDGVWTKVDPAEFTLERYLSSADTRRASWQRRTRSGALDAAPNRGHEAVVRLWETGRMVGCVTQNIDGLHTAAGLPDEAVVEVHGNARTTSCLDCGATLPTTEVAERVAAGDDDPACEECGGILKVDVVYFGEMLPDDAMAQAFEWSAHADAVLAIGSTLGVFPAASVPLDVVRAGHPMVIVNRGATEMDALATVIVQGAAGETLPELVAHLAED
jgi:NAD-dependent deacetylase